MRNELYRWGLAIVASLSLAGTSLANDEQLSLAASDARQVASIVEKMPAKEVPTFAGQVMQAVAKMPLSPRLRLQQMKDISVEFLKATPPEETAALLSQLILNVPFQMLPGWVSTYKPPFDELVASIEDAAYDKLATAVLKQIEAAELSDENKMIYSTFAIVLMAREKTPEENEAFANRMLAALPEAYRAQATAAMPTALAGDYSMLLGPAAAGFRLIKPRGKVGERETITTDTLGQIGSQPNLLIHDVNRPAPLPTGFLTQPPAHKTSTTTPIVPPPYAGQF